jgi:hypothetical protein
MSFLFPSCNVHHRSLLARHQRTGSRMSSSHGMRTERVRRISGRKRVDRQGSGVLDTPVQTRRIPAVRRACRKEGGSVACRGHRPRKRTSSRLRVANATRGWGHGTGGMPVPLASVRTPATEDGNAGPEERGGGHRCSVLRRVWQTLCPREEGRTDDLEHAVSPFCGTGGITDTGTHPCMGTDLPSSSMGAWNGCRRSPDKVVPGRPRRGDVGAHAHDISAVWEEGKERNVGRSASESEGVLRRPTTVMKRGEARSETPQGRTPGKESSPAPRQRRAVCGDTPHARFGEGGTGDPGMGDRPLLYALIRTWAWEHLSSFSAFRKPEVLPRSS